MLTRKMICGRILVVIGLGRDSLVNRVINKCKDPKAECCIMHSLVKFPLWKSFINVKRGGINYHHEL